MTTTPPTATPEGLLRTTQILTAAFVAAQLIFLGACHLSIAQQTPAAELGVLNLALPVVATSTAVLSLVMRRMQLGGLALAISAGGGAEALRADSVDPLPEDQARAEQEALLKRFMTGHIVGLALAESVTLLGFTHAFMAVELKLMLPYLLVGLGLTLIQFPTEAGLRSLLSPGARAALRG